MRCAEQRAVSSLSVLAVLVAATCLLGLGSPAARAEDKSFYFPDAVIDATIDGAGNMNVVETRTYQFSGTFHGAEEFIPLKTENVEIPARSAEAVSVADDSGSYRRIPFKPDYKGSVGTPGTFMTSQAGEKLTIVYFYEAANTQKRFVIKYRIKGAVVDWSDTAELAWYFIGPEWKVRTDRAKINIRLPSVLKPGELKVFAHGPLQGESTITAPGAASASIEGLQPGQYVAVRLLFPASATPGAPKIAQARLAQVMTLEKRIAEEANAERERQRRAREQTDRILRVMIVIAGICGGAVPLFGLALLIFMFFRYGREPKPQFQGEYLRELPSDDPPALVGWIIRQGGQTTADFVATMLDLGRRKYLKLEQEADAEGNRSYVMVRTDKPDTDLHDYEKSVLDMLFVTIAQQGRVPFDGLKQYAKDNPSDFRAAYSSFQAQVKAVGDSRNYFTKHGGLRVMVVLAGLFIVFVGVLATIAHVCLCPFGVIVGVLLVALNFTLKQWSPEGMEQLVKWRAFRKFLTDFSRLDEAPPASIQIWEHYLVYAVALGVAKEVMAQLKVVLPQVATSPENEFAYVWFGAGLAGTTEATPFDDLDSSFSSAVSASTPSSTSGGGGFSGGGFGGGDFGGGGGGDAW